jgi:Mn2+/Fe2+ NRAMP family transporter
VINGVVAVPIMAAMMILVTRENVMGVFTSGRRIRWLGWGGTALMGFAALMMGWDLVR